VTANLQRMASRTGSWQDNDEAVIYYDKCTLIIYTKRRYSLGTQEESVKVDRQSKDLWS
jgi:hypothetical protein